jgi:hypothetical protein
MSEVTLFNAKGKPQAYISIDEENAIYLWDGRAVAYIIENQVYGWNGQHLGWFDNGIMRTLDGNPVGFVQSHCPRMTKMEPMKRMKKMKKMKSMRKMAKMRKMDKSSIANIDLDIFLSQGAK